VASGREGAAAAAVSAVGAQRRRRTQFVPPAWALHVACRKWRAYCQPSSSASPAARTAQRQPCGSRLRSTGLPSSSDHSARSPGSSAAAEKGELAHIARRWFSQTASFSSVEMVACIRSWCSPWRERRSPLSAQSGAPAPGVAGGGCAGSGSGSGSMSTTDRSGSGSGSGSTSSCHECSAASAVRALARPAHS